MNAEASGHPAPAAPVGRRPARWAAALLGLLLAAPPAALAQAQANGYVEYRRGDAPVIITAPHGGLLMPDSIPDRTASSCGMRVTTVHDTHTAELARAIQSRFEAAHGSRPHVVIMHLHRRKIDANRPDPEATCGHPEAQLALREWHERIDAAKADVVARHGRGWLIDLHGHGRPLARLELGYLLSIEDLDQSDEQLDAVDQFERGSSIGRLSEQSPLSFSALLRGPASLGALYEAQGVSAIPSPAHPKPRGGPYFTGGHNTQRHTCGASAAGQALSGPICGVQIEAHFRGVRDTPENWDRFGDVTAQVLEAYLRLHWGVSVRAAQATPAARATPATQATPAPQASRPAQ